MTFCAHMSAFDPKRTLATLPIFRIGRVTCRVLSLGGYNEAARIHHLGRQRGGSLAPRSSRPAVGHASGRDVERTVRRQLFP